MKTYDLDNVLITPSAYERWMGHLQSSALELMEKYPDLSATEIPDEQLGIDESGKAFVFVDIRSTRIKMNVQPSEFQLKT